MRINKEGYRIIAIFTLITLCVILISIYFLPVWLAWALGILFTGNLLFTLFFFRDPVREGEVNGDVIFAPADGKIVVVEQVVEKEYLNDDRIQVSVFMSVSNVHVNWFPVSGTVEYFKYHPGKFLIAWNPKSSELNERTTTVVNTGHCSLLFRQVAGYVARRIVSYAKVGSNVTQNTECGFIKFGSRVDVLIPTDWEILVGIGDKVVGTQTPIARRKNS